MGKGNVLNKVLFGLNVSAVLLLCYVGVLQLERGNILGAATDLVLIVVNTMLAVNGYKAIKSNA